MKQLSRISTVALYPPFAHKLEQLVLGCNGRGSYYWATSGLRTYDEQDALYAKGRTTGKLGHIVTKARGGQSQHNFGIAVDFCLDADPEKPGLQPDYSTKQYIVLADEAESLALVSGGRWNSTFKDWPHVQLNIKQFGISLAKLDLIYRKGGYPAVFAYLDKWQWE